MKISAKIISVLLAGGAASTVFGQITASDLLRTSEWGSLSEAFTNDISSLFSNAANTYTSFTFGWDGTDPLTGTIVKNAGLGSTGESSELYFTLIDPLADANPEYFTSDLPIYISYLGNESGDDNRFGYIPVVGGVEGAAVELYEYHKVNNANAPDDPTDPYSKPSNPDILTSDDDTYPITVAFWHEDLGNIGGDFYPGNALAKTDIEGRFYIFEATTVAYYDGVAYTDSYYLFAIDDRESELVDFDDGLFLARVSEMIVPEPSALGLGAFAALLALGLTRRNRKA